LSEPGGHDPWAETASSGSRPAAGAPPWSTPDFNPWDDGPDTDPRPSPVPAPTVAWADDAPATGAPAPTIPWADDPLPVGRPASAPWAEAGFDPWGERQEPNHHLGPKPNSAAAQPPPTSAPTLGSVA
ncbi:MAG TPA: hypothetical protein VFH76_34425, partial [Kribbella sp.]|nr:hypothetical protein [Kribbella sp.]